VNINTDDDDDDDESGASRTKAGTRRQSDIT
jgi:hypothetical protein